MKERPILFSAPMVRAILEGRKTQTRRACKGQRELSNIHDFQLDRCPYGNPGDRLWVRESGWEEPNQFGYIYDADGCWRSGEARLFKDRGYKRRPSIFMPRWASRILLEITDVRVERLQDISEEDAWAEGVNVADTLARGDSVGYGAHGFPVGPYLYRALWESINGAGSWDANPWVWVIGLKRIETK